MAANKVVTLTISASDGYTVSTAAGSASLTIMNTDDATITISPTSVPIGTTLYTPVTVTDHYGRPKADTLHIAQDDPEYVSPTQTTLTTDAITGIAYLPLLANQAGTSPIALVLADDLGNQATTQPATAPSLHVSLGDFGYSMTPCYAGVIGASKGGLSGTIVFDPNDKAKISNQVRLIQAIEWTDSDGHHIVPGKGLEALVTKAGGGIEAGCFIDIDPEKWTKGGGASPFYGDNVNDPDNIDGQANGGILGQPAQLYDRPGINQGQWTCKIETVAIEGDTGQVLGAMTWGFKFAPAHDVKSAVTPLTPTVSNTPSATFSAALSQFHAYYDKK